MLKGIRLESHKKETKDKIISVYNKPKFVYIPLISCNSTDVTILAKKGEYVYKGSPVGKRKGSMKFPIISTVSGTVVDYVTRPYLNGEEVKCVKIENDFKEKVIENKKIKELDKQSFISILHDSAIIGMGGAGFPAYIKYDNDKIKTLLVNAVECEPYITADQELLREHPEEILESIDTILEINNIDEAVIAIKRTNIELIKLLKSYIGTYLKIKIVEVPNLYPMGYERTLIKEIFNITYDKYPIEKNIVVSNISTIYAIYEAIKYDKPLTDRIVTFAGDALQEPQNVLVKIGSTASEVIKEVIGYKNVEDVNFIAGGPMMGNAIKSEDLVITSNLNCILVLNNQIELPVECLRCGKCIEVCPMKLCPVLIKDNVNNLESLKKLQANQCIECGLCTYICPSKIQIREYVKQAKNNLKGSETNECNK